MGSLTCLYANRIDIGSRFSASASTEHNTTIESRPPVEQTESEAQYLEVPPTPGLGRSPLTPQTPGSLFPATPISNQGDAQNVSLNRDQCPADLTRSERDLDPTTLFVGGLETLGPSAWDEEKVAKFFGRFGGLESVKVVRPRKLRLRFVFISPPTAYPSRELACGVCLREI